MVFAIIGRFNPVHLGHVALIDYAIEKRSQKDKPPLILVGSCNASLSYRNMFSYQQRKSWLKKLYGNNIAITGLPDYWPDNGTWIEHLSDITNLYTDNGEVTFIGGSQEDLHYLYDGGLNTAVVRSRFAGDLILSASQVRDALIRKDQSIEKLVPQQLTQDIRQAFEEQWNKLRKV